MNAPRARRAVRGAAGVTAAALAVALGGLAATSAVRADADPVRLATAAPAPAAGGAAVTVTLVRWPYT